MYLSRKEKSRLLRFLGYGRLKADLWFVGQEEGSPERRKGLEGELEIRATRFREIMDLRKAQDLLGRPFTPDRKFRTQTWSWMARFALALLEHDKAWMSGKDKARHYIRERLGLRRSKRGNTFLTVPVCSGGPWIGPIEPA